MSNRMQGTGSILAGPTITCRPSMNSIRWPPGCLEMPDRILVTGSGGFVGRHLVPALKSNGLDVVRHGYADGDIASCSLPCEGVSVVCHLAARTFVPDSWRSPLDFYRTNLTGTLN